MSAAPREYGVPTSPTATQQPSNNSNKEVGAASEHSATSEPGRDVESSLSTNTQGERKKRFGELSGVALIFACGASLFSDGYVNAISGPVTTIITGYLYQDATAEEMSRFKTLFPSMAFVGTVIGMGSFGVLVDVVGRKWGMLICSIGLIIFSILAAGAWGARGTTGGLFAALIAYRFLIGIFIGGEYPAGSVSCAENTEQKNIKKNRQQLWFVLATNSAIDVAFILAPFVALILLWICGTNHLEPVWRLALGLGAIPPLSLLFFRTRMREPDSFQNAAIKRNLPWGILVRHYWLRLTAVSLVWFCYDFVSYPSGIYSSYFTEQLFPDASLYTSFAFSIAISAFYLGTFLGAAVVDWWGPKFTIMFFLGVQAIFGFALSGSFGYLRNHPGGLIVMYGIYVAAGEAGPGNCLGLLASKAVAPTAIRGRMYGIAAAVGKIGAFVGTYAYTPLQDRFPTDSNLHYSAPFYVGSGLAVLALLLVFFFIPPVVQDGIAKMDEEFLQLLRESGYDMSNVGLADAGAEPGRISDDGHVQSREAVEPTATTTATLEKRS